VKSGVRGVVEGTTVMKARRFARWVVRAAVLGALAIGLVYAATTASADEAPGHNTEQSTDGVIWF
jgi:hypothetical protein